MLRRLLLGSVAAVLTMATANAQTPITLNESNMTLTPRRVITQEVNVNSLPNFTEGTNQVWNLDTIRTTGTQSFLFEQSTNTAFPQATMVQREKWEAIVANRGFFFDSYQYSNSGGIFTNGLSTNPQAYGIGDLTSNPSDTFYIPAQNESMQGNQLNVSFPATAASMWESEYSRKINYLLSIGAFNMNKTPGYKISHFMQFDSVSGWGRMRFPMPNGDTSQYYNVLMVQRAILRIDSVYLAGSPAPEPLLDAFSLEQGDMSLEFHTLFYRENDFYPLLHINYGDDMSMTTPVSANITEVSTTSGINKNAGSLTALSVFPNPVTDQHVHVKFRKEGTAAWNINIINTLGQSVYSQRVNQPAGNVELKLELNSQVQNGLYIMQIVDDKGEVKAVNKISVAR